MICDRGSTSLLGGLRIQPCFEARNRPEASPTTTNLPCLIVTSLANDTQAINATFSRRKDCSWIFEVVLDSRDETRYDAWQVQGLIIYARNAEAHCG